MQRTQTKLKVKKRSCHCGNPEMGFDCVCDFVARYPGDKKFCCEYCGIYEAAVPRCNRCKENQ